MEFNGSEKAIIEASAEAIVAGRDTIDKPNLFVLNSAFQRREGSDAIVAALIKNVEQCSGGKYTIRKADPALFDVSSKGISLCLVRCIVDTPEGLVTELDDSMLLIGFGPYSNGLKIGAKRASREKVLEHRASAAKMARDRQRRQNAEQAVETFLGKLTSALRQRTSQHGDPELSEELHRKLKFRDKLTLEEVAYFAATMGVTIESLVSA
ncbi:MAG TPA: hypothetical protein VD907_05730 [Verrucomicrobiae bacterium]|nr:hypothetical protein [Verrucomicrobiae bacterium]